MQKNLKLELNSSIQATIQHSQRASLVREIYTKIKDIYGIKLGLLLYTYPLKRSINSVLKFFQLFSPNAGKYGKEKAPYLDTFHTVNVINKPQHQKNYDMKNIILIIKVAIVVFVTLTPNQSDSKLNQAMDLNWWAQIYRNLRNLKNILRN